MTSERKTFSDLPKSILRPLTLDEVAAIVDEDRMVVSRMIKRRGLPKSFLSRSKKASIGTQPLLRPIVCPVVHFDLAAGHLLSPWLRRRLLQDIGNVAKGTSQDFVYQEGPLRVDLIGSVTKTLSKMEALANAEAAVVIDPEIRGGLPVMRGTRIGVYEVADLCKVETVHDILAGFPSLTQKHLEHASLYAKAHPLNSVSGKG